MWRRLGEVQLRIWVDFEARRLGARNLVVARPAKQAMCAVALLYMLVGVPRRRHGGWWVDDRVVVWTYLRGVIGKNVVCARNQRETYVGLARWL